MGCLEDLAAFAPDPPPVQAISSKFNLENWIETHNLEVAFTAPYGQGGKKWVLKTCAWNSDHTNRSAFIIQFSSGGIVARCRHHGCVGKEWADLKKLFAPNGPVNNGYPFPDYEDIVSIVPKPKTIAIKFMSEIEKEDVDFLWAKRIPRGKITDFCGDPGVGKSTAASMIAATISRGLSLPFDVEPEAPLKTLIISAEDTPADVLRPRLERMNADLDMIAIPDPTKNLTPSEIAIHIEELIKTVNPALLIIDPIIAYTQGRNTNKASEVRDFLGPLATLGEKYKMAIITVRHLNKKSGESAMYRGQGSIDFAAVCRSGFIFAKDTNAPGRCFMSHYKSSLSGLQPTLEYFIDDNGFFRWGIETAESADEVLTPNKKSEKISEAQQFLEKLLSNGPMPSNEIKDRAAKEGIAWGTVWRAKTTLNIAASKERETGAWFWRLP